MEKAKFKGIENVWSCINTKEPMAQQTILAIGLPPTAMVAVYLLEVSMLIDRHAFALVDCAFARGDNSGGCLVAHSPEDRGGRVPVLEQVQLPVVHHCQRVAGPEQV